MKFLYSSSSSASSITTSDAYLYNPKNATSGCLTGMLRRLLRLHTLPTHPFGHPKEAQNDSNQCGELDCSKRVEVRFEAPGKGNPGIVAKLMGLDSMPQRDSGPSKTRLKPITRSRSMNCADTSWREGTMHRRIKSTLSFCEAPPFVEIETQDFFILSFEGGGKDKELVLKTRKSDKGFGELTQRRSKNKCKRRGSDYEKNKENEAPIVVSSDGNEGDVEDSCQILHQNTNLNQNSQIIGEIEKQIRRKQSHERRRSIRKQKENCSPVEKVENHDNSENSSPVSVLHFGELPLKPKVQIPEDSRLKNSNSRRKLSGALEMYKHPAPSSTNNSNNNDGNADKTEAKHFESWNNDRRFQNHPEMWEEISKLAETEMIQSNSIYSETKKLEEFKEIGMAFGLEILDQLISEFLELLSSK